MRVRMLGGFGVGDGERDLTPTGQPAQVVKVVAAHGGRMHWEEVAEILWPAAPPDRSRTRLRNVLSRLRTETGAALLARRGVLLQIAPDVHVDALEFDRCARDALALAPHDPRAAQVAARQAADLYVGDLLPEDRYAVWTLEPRERLRRRFLAVIDLLVQHVRQEDPEAALVLLERVIEVEPDAEDPYLDAAELLAGMGRRAASLRMVKRARRLAEEANLPASDRTVSLEAALHAQGARRDSGLSGGSDPPTPAGPAKR